MHTHTYMHTHTHTHTHGILLSHTKEWNLAICNNLDGPSGYYAKWNKPDRKSTFCFHLYQISRTGELIDTEIRFKVSGVESMRMGNYCLMVTVSTLLMRKILQIVAQYFELN